MSLYYLVKLKMLTGRLRAVSGLSRGEKSLEIRNTRQILTTLTK